MSLGCQQGELFVHDFSTGKDYPVLDVARAFLTGCHALINDRMPTDDALARDTETPSDG